MLFKTRGRHDIVSAEELNDFRCDVERIRQDLEEHFEAINANTNEQEIQNSFICEIDNRLNKVEEKVDELHFLLKQLVLRAKLSVELSKDEQRVFLILYTHEKFMKPDEIGLKAFLEKELVEEALTSMMDKGLPFEREILDGAVYFRMNKDFKLRQAKESIIKIDADVTSQFQNTLLNKFFED
ncbi:hypothetical protein KY359_01875 [Candidatus Woesearchaeota archaeon]|nr:hypothetical protein [Candidatus Woesearchaeota archaeon]